MTKSIYMKEGRKEGRNQRRNEWTNDVCFETHCHDWSLPFHLLCLWHPRSRHFQALRLVLTTFSLHQKSSKHLLVHDKQLPHTTDSTRARKNSYYTTHITTLTKSGLFKDCKIFVRLIFERETDVLRLKWVSKSWNINAG